MNRHGVAYNNDSRSLISRGGVFIYEVEQFYVPQNVLLPLGKQRYRQRPPRLPQCHSAVCQIWRMASLPELRPTRVIDLRRFRRFAKQGSKSWVPEICDTFSEKFDQETNGLMMPRVSKTPLYRGMIVALD